MANFTVVGGALNVRHGPSRAEQLVNIIQDGDVVTQLAGTTIYSEVSQPAPAPARTWVLFDGGDTQGWISLATLTVGPAGNFNVTNPAGANVRTEPLSPTAGPGNILATLSPGTEVPAGPLVTDVSPPIGGVRQWVRLDLTPNPSGWASTLLLVPAGVAPTVITKIQYKVTANNLNVRSGPSLNSSIIGNLALGATVPEGPFIDGLRWMQISTTPPSFVSTKFLAKDVGGVGPGVPRWYEIAKGEEGIKEFPGDADNPQVVKYLKSCSTLSQSFQRNDETAWCSAFVNWCVEQAGFEGTESAAARSWMHWGKPAAAPKKGCIVVLSRGSNPAFGHVGFFVAQTSTTVQLLGGNQHDSVNVTSFPITRVLNNGFRI